MAATADDDRGLADRHLHHPELDPHILSTTVECTGEVKSLVLDPARDARGAVAGRAASRIFCG